jgi:hypothetical protein
MSRTGTGTGRHVYPVVVLLCEEFEAYTSARKVSPDGEGLFSGAGPSPPKMPWRGVRGKNSGEGLRAKIRPSPKYDSKAGQVT